MMVSKKNTPLSQKTIDLMEKDKRDKPAGNLTSPFFDMERMEEALKSEEVDIPDGLTREELREFLKK